MEDREKDPEAKSGISRRELIGQTVRSAAGLSVAGFLPPTMTTSLTNLHNLVINRTVLGPGTQGEWQILNITEQGNPSSGGPRVVGIHAVLLHTGNILYFWHDHLQMTNGTFANASMVLDPLTNTFVPLAVEHNPFCSGHCFLPNGNVLVVGGHFNGHCHIRTFTPSGSSGTWYEPHDPRTDGPRWYPTCTPLPDGKVFIASGAMVSGDSEPNNVNYTYEIYGQSDGKGLLGEYFNDTGLGPIGFRRIDPTIDFNWGTSVPDPVITNGDNFSVRWTGQIKPAFSEVYTFTTYTDEGVRLWINGQLIIDKYVPQALTAWSASVTLQANQFYDIRMEYFDYSGWATAKLTWQSASQPEQVIPRERLYPTVVPLYGVAINFSAPGDNGRYRFAHLTIDTEEVCDLLTTGWSEAYVLGYAYKSPSFKPDVVPWYHVYNVGTNDHFFTVYTAERDAKLNGGYADAGISCYLYAGAGNAGDRVPIYRLYKPAWQISFFTTDFARYQQLPTYDPNNSATFADGWIKEGIVAYLEGVRTSELETFLKTAHPFDLYPRSAVIPSGPHVGQMLMHTKNSSRFLNLTTADLTGAPAMACNNTNARTWPGDGSFVLLPLRPQDGYKARYMIIGGAGLPTDSTSDNVAASNSCEILDTSVSSPQWQTAASLSYGRVVPDSVLLPNGKVLVVNGSTKSRPTRPNVVIEPVHEVELYDPDANSWSQMASKTTLRLYHSTAILIPDGRVLIAGTDDDNHDNPLVTDQYQIEAFTPPYLFDGSLPAVRPVLTTVPSSIGYDSSFSVSVEITNGASVASVVLMRPGSVTHSYNMEQRLIQLAVSGTTNSGQNPITWQLTLQSPPNTYVAPPGYYMLFVVDSAGVPAVAKFIQLL